jgi:proton-translocating NADH-quinone oxidoreductase, chain N
VKETLEGISALAAPIIVMVLGMVVLLMDLNAESTRAQRQRLVWISLLGLAGAFVMAMAAGFGIKTLPSDVRPEASYFGGGMVGDRFGALFSMVLCIIAALSLLMSDRYLEEKGLNQGEYYALILFSTAGSMMMAYAYDLVNVFIGLEILSVALYILSGFARRELRSEESAVKYFLLGAFASGFLMFGTALVYGAVGTSLLTVQTEVEKNASLTNFYTIAMALRDTASTATPLASSPIFVAGIALLIVGLGFKAAIVPFHSYAPDVYEGAPTSVTAFMSAGAKAGAFAAFLRVYQILLPSEAATGPYRSVLWGLAAATMIVGNVLAVRQVNIKRMLAYSSIAHAGYILLGVLATGAVGLRGNEMDEARSVAQGAVLYYLFVYTFMNLGAFAMVIWLSRRNGREFLNIQDYAGLARQQPGAAAVMAVFMLSLAGIPPAAGFFGKLYLFLSAVNSGYTGLAVLGLLTSVIGVYYYLNIIVTMYFRPAVNDFSETLGGGAKTAALIAAAATLLLGVIPVPAFSPAFSRGEAAPTASSTRSTSGTAAPTGPGAPGNSAAPAAMDALPVPAP